MTEEGPNLAEALSHFPLDFAWLAVLGLASGLYVRAFRRVPRGAAQPGHPTWKLLAFHGGLFTVALAVSSPIEYYGNALLWMNFLGFLILTMVAAPLILLGSPLTLAFRVAGPAGRSRLRRLYRGRLLTVATFPVVSWLAFAVVTYAWQFTSLTDEAAANGFVRDLQQVTLLLVALCFWTPALATDPLRWRLPHPLRALYVFVEMTHKGLFGGMFLSMQQPFHPGFAGGLPTWAGLSPIDDQRLGILILWLGGNLIFVLAFAGIIVRWVQYEKRNAHRTDWHLALKRRAAVRRRAALDEVFRRA
ncbi:MAG: cytochrome c oxidase assembly protein [Dehalococcoidia bacterium]